MLLRVYATRVKQDLSQQEDYYKTMKFMIFLKASAIGGRSHGFDFRIT